MPPEPKKVFIAATKQDQGKTTISLGLMSALNELAPPVGFIKPVGQRYVEIEGVRVDEDTALMRSIFPSECELSDMGPVTVTRNFTRDYIRDPRRGDLADKIRDSYARVAAESGSMVIEGTGHAGVGSCFDMSNADVASLLGAKVILVTQGGIGKPIDEVMLNESLFRERGVELLGVVLNKVLPRKLEEIHDIVAKGLSRKGIDLIGSVPYDAMLEKPSMRQILNEIGGRVVCGEGQLDNNVETVLVGAMAPHRALEYVRPNCLLITPGDRDGLILAAASTAATADQGDTWIAGLLLTGGILPHRNILRLVERTGIPVIVLEEDSYSVAASVNALKVKIQPTDTDKIDEAARLIREHLDIERIMERA